MFIPVLNAILFVVGVLFFIVIVLWIYERFLISGYIIKFTATNNLPRHPKMTGEMVKSAWAYISWVVGFYGISTFVGYLTPNPFSYK